MLLNDHLTIAVGTVVNTAIVLGKRSDDVHRDYQIWDGNGCRCRTLRVWSNMSKYKNNTIGFRKADTAANCIVNELSSCPLSVFSMEKNGINYTCILI